MKSLDEFEIIDYVPTGFVIWNIGKHMVDGYIPFVRVGGYDGCQVVEGSKKAYKFDEAQDILAITTYGIQTSEETEKYIKKRLNKKGYEENIKKVEKAIPLFKELGL